MTFCRRFCSIFNNKDVRKTIEGRRFIRQIRLHVTVVSLHREPPYNYVAKFAMTQWFWGTAVRMFAHQKRNINIKLKLHLSYAQSWFLSWWVALKSPRWSHWSLLFARSSYFKFFKLTDIKQVVLDFMRWSGADQPAEDNSQYNWRSGI